MRILAVSDSHHDMGELLAAIDFERGSFDMIVHCGDGAADMEKLATQDCGATCMVVKGNADHDPLLMEWMLAQDKAHPIMVVHGHKLHVEYGLAKLFDTMTKCGARLAFFGHTHRPGMWKQGDLVAINPGSISRTRCRGLPSFACVETDLPGSEWWSARFFYIVAEHGNLYKKEFFPGNA